MFQIHLNIQRLNIGGFGGDEMDLLDNLDSFHPSMSELEVSRLYRKNANNHEIVSKFRNRSTSYVERICLNLLLSEDRRQGYINRGTCS